jgi:aspartate aminotransferase
MTAAFSRRRSRVLELVKDIPGLVCNPPDGAFYIFPDVSHYFGKSANGITIRSSADLSMYLLHTAHVSSVMGAALAIQPSAPPVSACTLARCGPRTW